MAASELNKRGWHLTGDCVTELDTDENGNIDNIIKKALDRDLKNIGAAWLNDINSSKTAYVKGPGVLQLDKLLDVSTPKDYDESLEVFSISRLSLTDGHGTCSAVTLEPIKGLSLKTPPGSKLLLSGTVDVATNFLLLSNKNTRLLGGWVANLAEPWELKKTLAKDAETLTNVTGEGGPPPFVPFGQKIASDLMLSNKKDDFKSFRKTKEKIVSEEEAQFQRLRKAAIEKAVQLVFDSNVERVMEMGGLSPNKAASLLSASNGNINHAFNILHSKQQSFGSRERPDIRAPLSSVSNDMSLTFSKQNTFARPQGFRPPYQGPPQSFSNSQQYRYGHTPYNGQNNYNHWSQQQNYIPHSGAMRHGEGHSVGRSERKNEAGEERYSSRNGRSYNGSSVALSVRSQTSESSNSSALSIQKQTSAKENSLNHIGEGSRDQPGSNQNDASENSNDKQNTNLDTVSKSLDGSTKNSPEQFPQNGLKNSNEQHKIERQVKPNNQAEGAYRSNSEDHIVSNQQRDHPSHQFKHSDRKDGRHYNSKGGPHVQFRGQFGDRSNSEHPSCGAYHHQPYQGSYVTPAMGRQDYSSNQVSFPLRVGDRCWAKYLQDQQFYPAVVTARIPGSRNVLVTFVDYNEGAEVDVKDILPFSQQTNQVSQPIYGMDLPLIYPPPFPGTSPFVPSVNFNVAGGYSGVSYSGGERHNSYQYSRLRHY